MLRGVDRNTTILDGDFKRENGVKVVGANGVAIENLTARNFTENGFYWTGVLGYRGSYLTAYRNGDYGVFAFDSQWGVFDHSYASGSPDSGFYIGQCNPCHAVITDVTAEYNQLGYSGTNAGGDLFIVRSVFRNNRSGIVPNSLDIEALAPQGHMTIAGNLVVTNGSADAAKGEEIWDVVYGVGIGIVGGSDNQIIRNHLPGQRGDGHRARHRTPGSAGVPPTRPPATSYRATTRTGRAWPTSRPSSSRPTTTTASPTTSTARPRRRTSSRSCRARARAPATRTLARSPSIGSSTRRTTHRVANYKDTPVPPKQPNMANASTAKARPAGTPPKVDLASITRPS